MFVRSLLSMLLILLVWSPALHAAGQVDDHIALAGLKSAKVIFDVRVADLDKLLFNLELFEETRAGMVGQGVMPEMIVTFRGPGVKLLTTKAIDEESHDALRDLYGQGVRFEACAVALRIFKVDSSTLVPEVNLVGNVLNSQIAYQNKGYALIVIN